MKKTFSLILLTLLTLGLFRPITALAEDRNSHLALTATKLGKKSKTMSRSMKRRLPLWKQQYLTRIAPFTKATSVIWIKKKASKLTTAASLIGAL